MDEKNKLTEAEINEQVEQIFEEERAREKSHKKKTLYVCVSIFLIILTILSTIYAVIRKKRMTLPKSNIYVCDNKDEHSQFDSWLFDDLGVDWVPTFLVFKDGYYIGMIRGTISLKDFKSDLGSVVINSSNNLPTPDYQITNINGETITLDKLTSQHELCFIEITWLECPDCKEQEKLNNTIYLYYNASHFYKYYIKDDISVIQNYYK